MTNLCLYGHDMDVTGFYMQPDRIKPRCRMCKREHYLRNRTSNGWPSAFLWENDAEEFWFLRESGFTLRRIAAMVPIQEDSLRQALKRKGIKV